MYNLLGKKEMARRLVELRQVKGWDQQKFAEQLGKSQSEVSRWENGRVSASYDTVVKWAEVLGVKVDEFLEGAEPRATADGDGGDPTTDDVRVAVSRWLGDPRRGGIDWVPRLIEKVLDSSTDGRTQLALVEAIIAAGRNHTAYGEAMAAVQRGLVLEAEAADSIERSTVRRIAEESARIRGGELRGITSARPGAGEPITDEEVREAVARRQPPERPRAAGE